MIFSCTWDGIRVRKPDFPVLIFTFLSKDSNACRGEGFWDQSIHKQNLRPVRADFVYSSFTLQDWTTNASVGNFSELTPLIARKLPADSTVFAVLTSRTGPKSPAREQLLVSIRCTISIGLDFCPESTVSRKEILFNLEF